jgi:hypothetical protein
MGGGTGHGSQRSRSQRRQYGLVDRAVTLGWPRKQVMVIERGPLTPPAAHDQIVALLRLQHQAINLMELSHRKQRCLA